MADDSQYPSSRPDSKRKYDDHSSSGGGNGPRRPTGFSAPIINSPDSKSNPNPSSYTHVPPPVDEIQLAKQRAQEIAARIFNNAEAKRPRVENGGGFDDINGNNEYTQKPPSQQMSNSQLGYNAPSMPVSYGFQSSSRKIEIPNARVGVIIGKAGETIKRFQDLSGAKIQVTRDMDADPHSLTRGVELVGTPDQMSRAEQLIKEAIAEAEAGGSGTVPRRSTPQAGAEQFQMKVPNNKVGLVIGKGGETIKSMQTKSGARIQLIPLHPPPGDTSTERTVYIDGTPEQIEIAKQLVNEVISENRVRNPQMGGGYPPQQGFRPSWGPPGPQMQQPGYGYMQQPGAYPGQPPQGNTSQPSYPGYPPQPTSGGYSSGWDQQPNQQTMQQGTTGYDYYGQQQPHGGPSTTTDNSGYNYGQTYGQQQGSYGDSGYSQPPAGQQQGYPDVYGAYHPPAPQQPGYGSQTAPQTGYDHQQQGYSSSAPTYGTGVNSAQEGAASSYGAQGGPPQVPPTQQSVPPAQPPTATGYGSQQANTTPPSYPQGPGQPGYGVPPTSQPGYGSQPPPVAQAGYGHTQGQKVPPVQAVYGQTQPPSSTPGNIQSGYPPHSVPPTTTQSGYGQQDSSGHYRPPVSGYGSAPGYGQAPPYGTPPAAQTGYGYPQATTYSSEGAVGGTGNGASSYDATPVSQSSQPSGVTKASPQS